MRIVLMRHGIAIDREHPDCPTDADRPLTSEGERRTYKAARGLRRMGFRPHRVLSSPWLRARRTAEICAEVLDASSQVLPEGAIEFRDDLLPDADPASLAAHLGGLVDDDEVLVVGHAPQLDRLLSHLLGAPQIELSSLKKAGAASIVGAAANDGQLEWLLTPRALRRIGRS